MLDYLAGGLIGECVLEGSLGVYREVMSLKLVKNYGLEYGRTNRLW